MSGPGNQVLTVFRGRAGDHNDLGMSGSVLVGDVLSELLGLSAHCVGSPEPPLNTTWDRELAAALPALRELSRVHTGILGRGQVPVIAQNRCAVSLATLPVLARHHPEACVLWFDAHADLNTPETTPTGYLGGLVLAGAAGLWDSGLGGDLALSSIVLGGVRDLDPAEQRLVDDGAVDTVLVGPAMADRLREVIAARPVYFHLDCDALEPGIVPTDYRVAGGMTLDDLHAVCRVVAEHEIVGIEIAEFESSWSPAGAPFSPSALVDAMRPMLG